MTRSSDDAFQKFEEWDGPPFSRNLTQATAWRAMVGLIRRHPDRNLLLVEAAPVSQYFGPGLYDGLEGPMVLFVKHGGSSAVFHNEHLGARTFRWPPIALSGIETETEADAGASATTIAPVAVSGRWPGVWRGSGGERSALLHQGVQGLQRDNVGCTPSRSSVHSWPDDYRRSRIGERLFAPLTPPPATPTPPPPAASLGSPGAPPATAAAARPPAVRPPAAAPRPRPPGPR